MASTDFKRLAELIKNDGDFRHQPNTEIRMAVVIGYDPNYDTTAKKHSYPFVSITLAGDTTPMHRIRFSESYVPNIGDTVWVALSGPDAWVMGSLAGAPKEVIGQLRSPVVVLKGTEYTDTSAFTNTTSGTIHNFPSVVSTTPYLPNRIYRAELTTTFTISGAPQLLNSGTGVSLSGGQATVPTLSVPTIYTEAIQVDFPIGSATGAPVANSHTYSLPNNGVYAIGTNVGGWLNEVPNMINRTGPVIATGFGLADGVQVIGCNWQTTGTGFTGTYPSGATAQAAPSAWSNVSTNAYEVYFSGGTYSKFFGSTTATFMSNVNIQLLNQAPTIASTTATITTEPTVSVTNGTSGQNSSSNLAEVSIGVIAPNALQGGGKYQEITKIDITGAYDGKQITITGAQTFWEIPSAVQTPRTWNLGQGPQFKWQAAMKLSGSASFAITNVSQQMFIYDCGVAS